MKIIETNVVDSAGRMYSKLPRFIMSSPNDGFETGVLLYGSRSPFQGD